MRVAHSLPTDSHVDSIARRAPLALIVFSCIALFVPVRGAVAQQPRQVDRPFPAAKRHEIDAVVNRAYAAHKAPGVVVGIWIPGEGSYVAARGFADVQPTAADAKSPTTSASAASPRRSRRPRS